MALTINRKDEITKTEFNVIKQRFNQKTSSQAIYACVKFVVNHLPHLESEISRLAFKIEEVSQVYTNYVDTVKKKQMAKIKVNNIVSTD